MLSLSYIHNAKLYTLEELQKKIVKDGKTTAKGAGLTIEDLKELAELLKKSADRKKNTEQEALRIFKVFVKEKGLL